MKRLPQNFLSSLQSLEKDMRWGNTILYKSLFLSFQMLQKMIHLWGVGMWYRLQPLVPLSLHSLTKWDFKSNFPEYHYKDIYVWPDGSRCQILMAFALIQTKVDPS